MTRYQWTVLAGCVFGQLRLSFNNIWRVAISGGHWGSTYEETDGDHSV